MLQKNSPKFIFLEKKKNLSEQMFECWAAAQPRGGRGYTHGSMYSAGCPFCLMTAVHRASLNADQTALQPVSPCSTKWGLWRGSLLGWIKRVQPKWMLSHWRGEREMGAKHTGMLESYAATSLKRYMYRSSLSQEKLFWEPFNLDCSWVILLMDWVVLLWEKSLECSYTCGFYGENSNSPSRN